MRLSLCGTDGVLGSSQHGDAESFGQLFDLRCRGPSTARRTNAHRRSTRSLAALLQCSLSAVGLSKRRLETASGNGVHIVASVADGAAGLLHALPSPRHARSKQL